MKKAIIGGTGIYKLANDKKSAVVATKYGTADIDIVSNDGQEIAFLTRHGKEHTVAPHQINYKANIMALKELGVEFILATAAVGSCSERFKVGDIVVIRDFLDFTRKRSSTFFEDGEPVRHVLMHEPYCRRLTDAFKAMAEEERLPIRGEAVYVCTDGPRFETAAEIRMYAQLGGEVVGMTSVPEVVLAKEAGICYATVGIVTNMCTGLAAGDSPSHSIGEVMEKYRSSVLRCCVDVLRLPMAKTCCNAKDNLL